MQQKVACISRHGELDEIGICDMTAPRPGTHDLLVRMKYAALNHLDYFVIKGWPGLALQMPHVLGSDGCGIVEEIGSDVTSFQAGDLVTINPGLSCGKCYHCLAGNQTSCSSFSIKGEHHPGTFAEFFTIPDINALKIPNGYSLENAAAAPLVSLTAWRMLVTQARIRPGEIVFIHGAGGGVASMAIQIAKLFNAIVITTTSSVEKMQKAKTLGADHVIDYKQMPDYGSYVFKELTAKHGVDIVIDSVGVKTFPTSVKLLRTGGRLVTCGATTGPIVDIDIRQIFWKQIHVIGSTMSNQQEFRDVMHHVFSGKIVPVIDKVFPLDKTRQAEEYLSRASQFGKVLISR